MQKSDPDRDFPPIMKRGSLRGIGGGGDDRSVVAFDERSSSSSLRTQEADILIISSLPPKQPAGFVWPDKAKQKAPGGMDNGQGFTLRL